MLVRTRPAPARTRALGGPFHGVNIECLDDLTPEDLAALPVKYEGVCHDRWEVAPDR